MIWRRRVHRAWQLVRARRFTRSITDYPPMPPGSLVPLPGGVDMQDVLFWYRQKHNRGILHFEESPPAAGYVA